MYVGFTSVDSCDGEFCNTPLTACTGANDRMRPHVACGFQELWITLPAEAWKYSSDISWTHDLNDRRLGSSFQVNLPGVSKGNMTCIDSKNLLSSSAFIGFSFFFNKPLPVRGISLILAQCMQGWAPPPCSPGWDILKMHWWMFLSCSWKWSLSASGWWTVLG